MADFIMDAPNTKEIESVNIVATGVNKNFSLRFRDDNRVQIVPCRIVTETEPFMARDDNTGKIEERKHYRRTIYVASELFNLDDDEVIIDKIWKPIRKSVGKSIVLILRTIEEAGKRSIMFVLETLCVYLHYDPRNPNRPEHELVEDLDNEKKKYFLEEATDQLIAKLLEKAKDSTLNQLACAYEMAKIIES